jgi:hypothetical protein
MKWVCNKKWYTQDTTETLMLECIYQHLKYGGLDEFLRLPITILYKHPLCLSVGHRHHGFQMRTGFKTIHPTSLEEDYDESLSNICFETLLSNRMKWNYPEESYEAMLEDLLKVRTETAHYKVPNDCPRYEFGVQEDAQLDIDMSDNEEDAVPDDADFESDNDLLEGDI